MKSESPSFRTPCGKIARRDFLISALAGPIVAQLAGCRRGSGSSDQLAKALRSVETSKSQTGGRHDNPVSVAWDPSIHTYPRIHEMQTFGGDQSPIYGLVARALMLLGPDDLENPLKGLIRPGDTVVIKPNWCSQAYFPFPITHPSVVYPLVEFALKAGAKRVHIVETPMTLARGCEWFWSSALVGVRTMTKLISERYHGAEVRFIDGNADEFVWVDVGDASELKSYDFHALEHDGHSGFEKNMFHEVVDCRGTNPHGYRPGLAALARSYLDCDVFINVPKLKTHGYTGLTAAIKNLMGLNVRSTVHKMPPEQLREYQQRPDYAEWRESPMRDVPHFDRTKLSGQDGPWFGATIQDRLALGFENDVLWRTLADLNKMIRYADANGSIQETPQRRYLTVVDAVVGTDGNGPITDSLCPASCIVAGTDPIGVDAVCAHVMGWDARSLNLINNCHACTTLPFGSADDYLERMTGVDPSSPCFRTRFRPPDTYAEKIISPFKLLRA